MRFCLFFSNLECEIRSVLFMGLMIEWKSGILQNHEIPLKKDTSLTAIPIYLLSERELETLREYIEKNLVKGYIRPSKLLTKYSILFVLKKDGKLRIYVDYKKLNDIIIKNRYILSLIFEI
jgi:hypothetical protein